MDAAHYIASPTASVEEWIEGLPVEPTAYLSPTPIPAPPSPPSLLLPTTKKRKALTEVDGNPQSMSQSQADKPAKTPTQQARKRRLTSIVNDDTPRAQPELTSAQFSFETYDASSTSRSSASASSKARSGSPSKRVGDLQLLERTITYVSTNNETFPLPLAAKEIISKIKRITTGRGLVPASLKNVAKKFVEQDELAEYNFGTDSTQTQISGAYSPLETWERVAEIIEAAALCEGDLCSESAWNAEVHCRLLGVALRGWRSALGLSYMDVTTARIESSNASLSKMVDYALVLVPNYSMHKAITIKLREANLLSINHTKAEYVRFKPITVSIETKRPGMDEDNAKVQLGVWAAAHFERLQILCGPDVVVPFLPEVIVQGHDWRFKIASMMSDGNVILHGDWAIGDTRTTIGIYKILAAIQVLADWSIRDYQEWFLRSVLG